MRRRWSGLLVLALLLPAQTATPQGRITQDEVVQFLLKQSNCVDPAVRTDPFNPGIRIEHLEYFDLTGDGRDEAIVLASTCFTGTAGPDIHTVFSRDRAGKLVELPLPDPDKSALAVLQGNINADLSVKNGVLVEIYGDNTDRPERLSIAVEFSWAATKFVVHAVKKSPFRTSFDCAKAAKEPEQTICYVYDLAELDLRLSDLYRARLKESSPEGQKALQDSERKWLTERNTACDGAVKDACLKSLYEARIAQLQKR